MVLRSGSLGGGIFCLCTPLSLMHYNSQQLLLLYVDIYVAVVVVVVDDVVVCTDTYESVFRYTYTSTRRY